MDGRELAYLILVIVAMSGFALALAYASIKAGGR
jgi:hypothetical protein